MKPTREGWYRARWQRGYSFHEDGGWECVKVAEAYDGGFCVWNNLRTNWLQLLAVEEWGERVWMPGDRV